MWLTRRGFLDHVANLVALIERYGASLGAVDPVSVEDADLGLSFALEASLPGAGEAVQARLAVRERWSRSASDGFERAAYAYELLDPARDLRRAFHLHDPEWFMARFLVLTHEHCEQPIGLARCAHLHGQPVRDAYRGIELLMAAWLDEVDCTSLPCLE